jgi:OOP family OmpA-OmpF porin
MKNLTILFIIFICAFTYSQNAGKESWSVGFGVSNFTMQGDLVSIGNDLSDDDNSLFNVGGYVYVDKMFTPAFGLELKGHYTQIGGSAQERSNSFFVGSPSTPLSQTRFEGNAYGAELNLILNLSSILNNPYQDKPRNWNLASYVGWGLQTYDSQLISNLSNTIIQDFSEDKTSSNYFTVALGLKYKINNKLDLELRPSINFNEDDHLDGAASNKQNFEIFFQTNLGLVFKLNSKENDNFIWQDQGFVKKTAIVEKPDFEQMVDVAVSERLKDFNKDSNIDTDKDGFIDSQDACPLRYSKDNNGCPGDKDKDGVADDFDLCPSTPGPKNNMGCPKPEATQTVLPAAPLVYMKNYISEHIYFDINRADLTTESKNRLNNIVLFLSLHPNKRFEIQGNTDKGGNTDYNQKLSEKRANVVKDYLVGRGVNKNSLEVIGNGENTPRFENNEINRNNRRVDVTLKN